MVLSFFKVLLFWFWMWVTLPSSAQSLLLVLLSGITPGVAYGTIRDADDQNQVCQV